jgi:hypothetical protein
MYGAGVLMEMTSECSEDRVVACFLEILFSIDATRTHCIC